MPDMVRWCLTSHSHCLTPGKPVNILFLEYLDLLQKQNIRTQGYSGVRYAHVVLGLPFPSSSCSLDSTMQGLKRCLAKTAFHVLPIDPKVRYKKININKNKDLALWCSFLVALYCLFLKANCVPKDSNFDVNKILTGSNIRVDTEKRMVYVYCCFSKTNQYRK